MDLSISINKLTSKLKHSVFIKPTNSFQYLQINSNHPQHIFKNLIYSLFIRIRRICSEKNDYFYFSMVLTRQLEKRGYNKNLIDKILMMVLRLDRDNLIEYKVKNSLNLKINLF